MYESVGFAGFREASLSDSSLRDIDTICVLLACGVISLFGRDFHPTKIPRGISSSVWRCMKLYAFPGPRRKSEIILSFEILNKRRNLYPR